MAIRVKYDNVQTSQPTDPDYNPNHRDSADFTETSNVSLFKLRDLFACANKAPLLSARISKIDILSTSFIHRFLQRYNILKIDVPLTRKIEVYL